MPHDLQTCLIKHAVLDLFILIYCSFRTGIFLVSYIIRSTIIFRSSAKSEYFSR